jgi:hypothetical protein
MGRLLSLALVFLLSILGVMAISFFEISVTTPVNNNTERLACEIADTSTEDRVTEVDGVRFEIVVPQRIITIPPKKPDAFTEVKFGLKITNNSPKPYIFSQYKSLWLNIIAANGEKLAWGRQRSHQNIRATISEDYSLLQPSKSVTFFIEGRLNWNNDALVFSGASASTNGFWNVRSFKLGRYRVSLTYFSDAALPLTSQFLGSKKSQFLWNGHVATPFIDLCLVNT